MQVLDAIKSDPKTRDILVAMISARAQTVDHDEARRRGADAYFIKPFSPLQVVAWVRSHMS
jgi:CheY-like chemotaxis protein